MAKKRSFIVPIAAAAALVLAFVLNPSPERHRATIKSATTQQSPLAGMLGLGSLKAFVSSYHSLGVASYTTAGERTVSVGAFGMVFVTQ